jgi:hypothetical protein
VEGEANILGAPAADGMAAPAPEQQRLLRAGEDGQTARGPRMNCSWHISPRFGRPSSIRFTEKSGQAVTAFVDDPHRFRNAKAVGCYFGLVPCQDQSGDKNRLGHITREGAPVVRQLVAEAAWQAQRRSPTVRAYFERAQRGDPQRKKIALVATAHYLVRVMWALLKRGTVWQEKMAS